MEKDGGDFESIIVQGDRKERRTKNTYMECEMRGARSRMPAARDFETCKMIEIR
jgi:hypothetical protein